MVVADVKVSSIAFEKTCCFRSRDDQPLLPEEGKGKRKGSPGKVKNCELADYNSLPKYMKHNEFILGYYRCNWPLKDTVLSIFSMHNETLNVWTHLVGFFIFLALTAYVAMMAPRDTGALSLKLMHTDMGAASLFSPSNSTAYHVPNNASSSLQSPTYLQLPEAVTNNVGARFPPANATSAASSSMKAASGAAIDTVTAAPQVQPIARWPFFVFLCGAMFCLLTSSACHLLSCHSEHTSYVMLRLDYAGISALIVTSIFPVIYYIFACNPFLQAVYASAVTICGIATILVSLFPVFETPEFRIMRSLLFACMALLGWVPVAHKLMLYGDRPEALLTTLYEFLLNSCYAVGVVIYATRVPERWFPGKFDLVGHSHQLFHVLVIAGACIEYLAIQVYLEWRDRQGC